MLPMMLGGESGDAEWIDNVITTVGLKDRIHHRPSELSGGQQQRVAVARALASRPQIIFADEPTGNLDSTTGAEILDFMRRAVTEFGQTIVMVTHDPVAASYADRAVFVADGKLDGELLDPDVGTDPRAHEADRQLTMAGSTSLIARKSIRARLGRTIAIVFAVVAGVSFVSGSFVLADSLKQSFDGLIEDLVQDVDLQVRGVNAFEDDDRSAATRKRLRSRSNSPTSSPRRRRRRRGRTRPHRECSDPRRRGRPDRRHRSDVRYAVPGRDTLAGIELKSGRAARARTNWCSTRRPLIARASSSADTSATRPTPASTRGAMVGTVGTRRQRQLPRCVHRAARPRHRARPLRGGRPGRPDQHRDHRRGGHRHRRSSGHRSGRAADVEIVDRDVPDRRSSRSRSASSSAFFETGLLIFAFITAFVAAFIINNVFQITIGQRLRELALLRAIGASGRQVRRMITIEAFGIGVLGTISARSPESASPS